jgi:predicted dehydrogenase
VALIDTHEDCQNWANNTYNQIPFYSQFTTFLAQQKADVVCICTPNGTHASLAIQALQNGSHVVIEKPMALSKSDCEQVIFTSMQHHKLVFCVMQNRYSPPSIWLKELVMSGKLGKIFMVQVNCYWNRDERYYLPKGWHGTKDLDGGTLFTQFSHFIDLMYWLFGDIKVIKSVLKNFNHAHLTDFEDTGTVLFDFLQGGSGIFSFSTAVWDKNLESSMTIIAENGTVKVGGQYMESVLHCHVKDYTMPELPPTMPPNDYGAYKGSAANHHFVIQNIIDVLQQNVPATTNALEGMKVVEIIEKMYQGAAN